MPPMTRATMPKTINTTPMSFTGTSRAGDAWAGPSCSKVFRRSLFKECRMKYVTSALSAAILLIVATAFAQPPAGGGQMQGQKIGLATSLQRGYAGFKNNFTAAAEKMPDADYSFKVGSMPEARTYGQRIAHIAQAQFGQCSALTGVANPMAG